jgi:hypothetical protein
MIDDNSVDLLDKIYPRAQWVAASFTPYIRSSVA